MKNKNNIYEKKFVKPSLIVLFFSSIPFIGLVDYITGHQLSFSIFYLAPILAITWVTDRQAGYLSAVFSAVVWFIAENMSGVVFENPLIPFWNALMRLAIFVIIVLMFSIVKNLPKELEERVKEKTAELTIEVTQHKQAQAEIKRQLQCLNALREIDRAITSSTDLNLLTGIILSETKKLLNVDAVIIFLFDSTSNCLQFVMGLGFLTNIPAETTVNIGEGIIGNALLERKNQHIVVNNKNCDELCCPFVKSEENFIDCYALPLIARGNTQGVLGIYCRKKLIPDASWMGYLNNIANQTAIAIDNYHMYSKLQYSNMDLLRAYDDTIEGWSHAMDLRDKETEGHTLRVTELTIKLARVLGVRMEDLVQIKRGALLHDIGKIGVPDSILLKPGALTEEEWIIMKKHPTFAYELLTPIRFLRPAMDIPYCHHEKWDGSGYPQGLKGEGIPLAARIFSVVDVFDALTSDRPYRKAWTREQAIEYINEQSGKHFDPTIVEVFLQIVKGA